MRGGELCNHALTKASEAHQWALEAAHLLEENIEWLSWLATRMRSSSCQHSHSHGHLKRQSRRCTKTPVCGGHTKVPLRLFHQENQRWKHVPSPSPTQPRRQVTFQDQKGKSLKNTLPGSTWDRHPVECDLGPQPALAPELESFLGGRHPCEMWKGV